MSGNSVGLYGSTTSTANIAGGNTSGLYRLTTAVNVDDGYNDQDVQAFLESYTGNIQCGNIDVLTAATVNAIFTDGYYFANGTPLDVGINSYGNANVAAFLPTYTGNLAGGNLAITSNILVGQNLTTTGGITSGQTITSGGDVQATGNLRTLGASGNITGANYVVASYFVGDGSQLSNITSSYGNSNVSNYLASGTNSANIITTGNISGSYILGNGSLLTGLPETYSNANVTTLLANFGSNSISTTGNITAGLFTGSGAGLSAVPGANITGTVANATYAVSAGTATTADSANAVAGANVTGQVANALVAGTVYTAAQPNITSVGTLSTLAVSGNVSAGNITTEHIVTTGNVAINGVLFSDDITSTSVTVFGDQIITGNLTVQGNTTTINSNVIVTNDKTITVANNQSTSANVDGAGIEAGNPAVATWLYNALTDSWQSNIAVTPTGNLTQDLGKNTNRWATVFADNADISANITALGNISGSYILGNGSQLTGLPESYSNANVVSLLASFGSNTISTTGNISAGNLLLTGNVIGDDNSPLSIVGGTNGNISLNVFGGTSNGNIVIEGSSGNGNIQLNPRGTISGGKFVNISANTNVDGNIVATGNVSGTYILGNGSQLTGITSTYGNANVTTLLAAFGSNTISTTGNITAGNIIANGQALTNLPGANVVGAVANATYATDSAHSIISDSANAVAGGNVTGQVANALIAGTVYTAAQPNITSVGTLSTLTVSGNIGTAGILTDNYYYANGTPISFGGDYGDSNVTTLLASLGSNIISSTANITTTANVSGAYFIGNGSALSSITGANVIGAVANATYATSAGTADSATTAATVTGNAQANITSVGTLTSLSVTGNITSTGNISGGNLLGIGSGITGINAFGNIAVAGETTVSADNTTDTLTLVAGTNITLTTDAANNKITITSTAAGGGETLSPFLLMGG